jgi:hypothetical protein
MAKRRSRQLDEALRTGCLVRFSRRFDESPIHGYVLDVGPKFFLLSIVSDHIWFDGFSCFRIADVRDLAPDPYASFMEVALSKRGERAPKKPRVSVKGVEELLLSANRAFSLITLHLELADPEVCWIGRALGVERGRVSLQEISPNATWDEKLREHRLSEITRVDFGGDYEEALHLVGGDPPQPN